MAGVGVVYDSNELSRLESFLNQQTLRRLLVLSKASQKEPRLRRPLLSGLSYSRQRSSF